MKKILLVILIYFIHSGGAFGEIIYLMCKKNNNLFSTGEDPLKVDFDRGRMVLGLKKIKLEELDNFLLSKDDDNKSNTISLKLNRISLVLEVKKIKNNSEIIDAKLSYQAQCRIVDKKL